MPVSLFDLYSELRSEGIVFCFSGPTSQSIVEGIGDALRQKMEREDASLATSRKVFAIFVEQMQNVVNHSVEQVPGEKGAPSELRYGIVVVGQEDGRFFVWSGNYIDNRECDELEAQLATIRRMDKDQLKAYFKEQRRAEQRENKTGAGLGFIETARKASEPIEYRITRVDEYRSFFSIKAMI